MSGRRDFLFELGTEELPPKALRQLELALRDSIGTQLDQLWLVYRKLESFSTPRRLAVRVRRLAESQPDIAITRRGPPVQAAFDPAGNPTRAASAFAASCGVALSALVRETDPKGNEYLAFTGVKPGQSAASLLPGIVHKALDALPIPKRMRWGDSEAQFVRPVHWVVMLYGREVLESTILETRAGNSTRGHRFMAPAAIRMAAPVSYEKALLSRGKVIASFETRRDRIREQVVATATELGGRALIDAALLDEVTALVEWPVALAGQFEPRFLRLPREVLISTLQDHQRYFPVEDAHGRLLPNFITLSNIDSTDVAVVRAGNERVVRPRLADAAFFYEQDRKQPLVAQLPALDQVAFQAQLGSIGDKVRRVITLAESLCAITGANPAQVRQAAELCKCDLLCNMVGEFPELQGVIGSYYAAADGVPAEVATAVREHYLPRGAGDSLPATRTGLTLALADRLDTLAGIFAIGQKPSGTRDPFALRRAAIGVLRMSLEQRLPLDLARAIDTALDLQPVANAAARAELLDFFMERLRAQFLETSAATGISTEMFNAVQASAPATAPDFEARLRALAAFLQRPESGSLTAANKRIANILKKSAASAAHSVDAALLSLPQEQALARDLAAAGPAVDAALAQVDYAAALNRLAGLRAVVDAFFDGVLVNDPDARLQGNRLALLAGLRGLFTRIADLSLLPG
jgi:glycyl-tRNA synthetase beta chain